MQKSILILSLVFFFFSCSGSEPNLQLSNPEAFAFDLGDSWEVNASIKAIGFLVEEKEGNYFSKLSYSVDLISQYDSLVAIYNDRVDKNGTEEILDIMLEAQIEIDSSIEEGDYKLIFNVTDELSKQTKSLSVDINLSK